MQSSNFSFHTIITIRIHNVLFGQDSIKNSKAILKFSYLIIASCFLSKGLFGWIKSSRADNLYLLVIRGAIENRIHTFFSIYFSFHFVIDFVLWFDSADSREKQMKQRYGI